MPHQHPSSRTRYRQYRRRLRAPGADQADAKRIDGTDAAPTAGTNRIGRGRGFTVLFCEFWRMLKGHRRTLLLALTTLSVATLLGLVPLYGTKLVFDNVLGGKALPPEVPAWIRMPADPKGLLGWIAIVMVGLSVISLAVGMWGRWQATRISKRVAVSARRKLFEHAVRLPLHRVYQLKSGGVASILREDAGGIGELVFSMIYNPSRAVIQLLGSLFVLIFVDWRMLLGSLALIPTVWYTHRTWVARIRPFWRDIRKTRQAIDGQATESFGGIRIVRGFGRHRTETNRFTLSSHLMARQELFAWWWMRGVDSVWAVLIPLATAVLLWYGGSRVLSDAARVSAGLITTKEALSVGDLVVFLAYLTALLGPIATLAQSATALQNNLAGFDRTLDLLAEPLEMHSRSGAVEVDRTKVLGRITLRNVTFAYPGTNTSVLSDVNLDVAAGQTVALVGPSGAGKTTLCNLVARFYDPQEGRVELDGVDLRDMDVEGYRRLFGIVEQDTFLFDGTIADNIGYGRRDATADEIAAAARLANAHNFIIDLENGYDTVIGERGVRLSGGQRQRLTIARAILANPRILILDEATSNLDTASEQLIQGSLRALMSGRTSFVIAHRLSTVACADRIAVMDKGRIVEEGTHDELMARSGRYRRMVELQTQPAGEGNDEETSLAEMGGFGST
ncbi:MAG: ABC transporter ATP-binding protein/permease [Phycisphaerales bacterium]|nr:ABC transporter ATP-binding protein/permease [Phycisphaerales bacterium]